MQVDRIVLEIDQYVENGNLVKDMVLDQLLKDGAITQEQHEEYSIRRQVIVFKHSWFKRWMKKLQPDSKDDTWSYRYVKFEDSPNALS